MARGDRFARGREPGTAIGDALAASVSAAQGVAVRAGASRTPSRIVLLSDGRNTVGQPLESGAAQAQSAAIPVSTIAYGTDGGMSALGALSPARTVGHRR